MSSTPEPIELFPFRMFDPNIAREEADFRPLPVSVEESVPKESVEPSLTVAASTPLTPTEEELKAIEEEEKKASATASANAQKVAASKPGPASPIAISTTVGKQTPLA